MMIQKNNASYKPSRFEILEGLKFKKMQKIFFFFYILSTCIHAQTNILKNVDSLLVLGNYKAALVVLENSKIINFEILNKTGNIYQQVGNYTKAIVHYKHALELNSSSKTKENLGKCYQKTNQIDEAIALFTSVLEENPSNALLKYHVAKLYKSRREFDKAKNLFKDLIYHDNTNPNYHYYLGSTYLNLKEKDSAKTQFLKTLENDSIHYKSLYNLVKIYRKPNRKYLKLIKRKINNDSSYYYLIKGLKFYPKSNSLNKLAANYYFVDEDYAKTINYLNNLSFLTSENKQTLAVCYYYIKNYEKSKDYLYALMDSNKATSKTLFYLALVYKAEKDFEKAEMYMQHSIKAEKPQLTEFYFQLGLIHQEYNKLQDAITDFKMALKENKFNAKAQYQLALTCDSFYKDKTIAIKLYESYLKKFSFRDKKTTLFAKQRIKDLKTIIFNKK